MKTIQNRCSAFGTILFFIVLFFVPISAQADHGTLPEVMNSVVHISGHKSISADGKYESSIGTGYIVAVEDDRVIIATNCHVVCGLAFTWVHTHEGSKANKRIGATFLMGDLAQDIAFLSVPHFDGAEPLKLLDGKVNIGEHAVVIGSPNGFTFSVSKGVISYPERPTGKGIQFISHQTDAAINKGNSGGPLLVNRNGEYVVAGMNTMIYSKAGENNGLGFSVVSTDIIDVLDHLLAGTEPTRNSLGVAIDNLSIKAAKALNVPSSYLDQGITGVYVSSIVPNSSAAKVKMQPMDIILQVGDTSIRSTADAISAVQKVRPNHLVHLRIMRGDKMVDTYVIGINTWGFKQEAVKYPKIGKMVALVANKFGVILANPATPGYLKLYAPHMEATDYQMVMSPVVTMVVNKSNAHKAGIRTGQFISGIFIEGMPKVAVTNQKSLLEALDQAAAEGSDTSTVALQLKKFTQETKDGPFKLVTSIVTIDLD